MQKVLLIASVTTGSQIMTTLGFLLLDATATTAVVTNSPVSSFFGMVVAVITLLSSLGVFALLFRIGLFVGTANQRLTTLEANKDANIEEVKGITTTLGRHSETLAVMTSDVHSIKQNLRIVRERQHDLANVLTQVTLKPVQLKPIGSGGDNEN